MIRLLLVDDQPLVRAGLRRILEPIGRFTIVGECDDGDEVLEAVSRTRPDVIIMDVRMRRMSGPAAIAELDRALQNPPPVVILTTFDDEETVAAALEAGAAGFVLKDAPGEAIVRSVDLAIEGGAWLDPRIAPRVMQAYRTRRGARLEDHRNDLDRLTPRETDVVREVGLGSSNAEVGRALSISEATVKTHLASAQSKLALRDRAATIVFAHACGLVGA